MKKFTIVLCIIPIFSSISMAEPIYSILSMDTRGYTERAVGYDGIPYTEFGANVRIRNGNSQVSFKKGVVFSPAKKDDWAIGNHQWYYTGMDLLFYDVVFKDLNVSAEIFTEINPIEGNDFGYTKQKSSQSVGLSYKGISIKRGKWTNGDFYTDIGVKRNITETASIHGLVSFVGERGKSSISPLSNDRLNFIELGASKWLLLSVSKNLDFSLKGGLNLRQYFFEDRSDLSYVFSIGFLAR